MQRPLAIALVLLLVAVMAGLWWSLREDPAPLAPAGAGTTEGGPVAAEAASAAVGATEAATRPAHREVVAAAATGVLDDPEFVAGLTGWKGRVVDHTKKPVADCGVRLYRGALDSVLTEGLDVFADQSAFAPQYVAGETRTANDGTFLIARVRPQGFFLLLAGIGTDSPTHQILSRMPSPGEVVDLGDVELVHAGVIVGTVVDEDGEPMPGALVRAADLPGAVAALFPLERFDPKGAVLVREQNLRSQVLPMPEWVEAAFEQLPIPSARTDASGAFRLVGVTPGSNLVATTQRGFLSDVKPSVPVRPGQVKDVGRIKLKRGEELSGRVLDGAGKPVAGAEIFAGSTISMAPVDLAQRLEPSDADGRFGGPGFAPGKVTVAARRGKGHPWVLAEPQPVFGEVVVTLPATYSVTATITLADGKPAMQPRFRLLQGKAGQGAAEMHLLGLAPPIDLAARQRVLADGVFRFDHLQPGHYTLLADAPGHATAFAGFEIVAGDATVALQLAAPNVFHVVVVDSEDQPVRNASIYAEPRGKRYVEMPLHCGRTGADGRLEIAQLQAESLRVSAEHPRWGVVHGEAKPGQELRLQMEAPGALRGLLLENGKPPTPGKYSVAVMVRGGKGPRGPLEGVPGLLTPGLDGSFAVQALQPGRYRLVGIDSLATLRSPGGVMALAQNAFLQRDRNEVDAEVVAGGTTEVTIEAGERPIDGPTAVLAGSVTVNGRAAEDYVLSGYAEERRLSARVDARGRFDFGVVPASRIWINLHPAREGGIFFGGGSSVWSGSIELQAGEAKELTIELTTTSVSGRCFLPDGAPAAGVFVQGQGRLTGSSAGEGNVWLGSPTDASGAFTFRDVAAGTYSFTVRGGGESPLRGTLEAVEVTGAFPVESLRIDLRSALVVKGKLDLSEFTRDPPKWCWIGFQPLDAAGKTKDRSQMQWAGVDLATGNFQTDDLGVGRYHAEVYFNYEGDRPGEAFDGGDVDVPPAGLVDLQLRPRRKG
ncbi:MAG: carboxypeptidase regulatory-like domain-containing protein [Planctomycetes bacterium]|nr:carboxypeptidase regulatory-like domain-containing protein [Planctomycetota bacterium]